MKALPIIGCTQFLVKLTGNKLTAKQIVRATAYLRAKRIAFYDNWSKEHCMLVDTLNDNKPIVLDALRATLN